MELSRLVFNSVKNVKYLEDTGFNYESFVRGEYDNDLDYANSINNAFTPINEAIHRLSDRNKIKYKITKIGSPDADGLIDLSFIKDEVKSIVNVFIFSDSNYIVVPYRTFGEDKIALMNNVDRKYLSKLFMEYKEDIKHFTKDDIYHYEIDNEVVESRDVDLKKYGITDTMCSYIIEYVQGKLEEPIAPELANMHLTRAEQYMDDLDEQQTSFFQKTVQPKYGMFD